MAQLLSEVQAAEVRADRPGALAIPTECALMIAYPWMHGSEWRKCAAEYVKQVVEHGNGCAEGDLPSWDQWRDDWRRR